MLTLGSLAWFAVRFSDRDQRALLVVLTCSAVLMVLEVLTPSVGNTIHLGIAGLMVVAGRSLALMGAPEDLPSPDHQAVAATDHGSRDDFLGFREGPWPSSETPPGG